MKTLEDFKNEVAIQMGYNSFEHLYNVRWDGFIRDCMQESALRFAKYIQEETIKKCAKILERTIIDKKSILNIERILK